MRFIASRPFADPDHLPLGEAVAERARIREWVDGQTDCRAKGYVVDQHPRAVRLPGGITTHVLNLVVRQQEA